MRIGISVRSNRRANFWNGGLERHLHDLACLISHIPFVEAVVFVNSGERDEAQAGLLEFGRNFQVVSPNDACELLDCVIEGNHGLDPELIRRFRARGGKVVFYPRDEPFAELVETTVFNREGFFREPEHCDEIWLQPQYRMFSSMVAAIHRCPVRDVPLLWSPDHIERASQYAPEGSPPFGYDRGVLSPGNVRAAIFEPNLSPTAMGLIPLLICEDVERLSPGAIERIDMLNGHHMTSQTGFIFFMQNLQLYEKGRVLIHADDHFRSVMVRGSNLVIAHQIDQLPHDILLDCLHGGYPVVHNSPFMRDLGYYYDGFDVRAGIAATFAAIRDHDQSFDDYASRSRARLGGMLPAARANIDAYARRLVTLSRGFGSRRAA